MLSIRDFVPPILVRTIARYIGGASTGLEIFSSYNEAASACSSYGYQQEELIRVVQARTRVFRESVHAQKPLVADYAGTRILLALNLALDRSEPDNQLNVLDFGGACGAHYFTAKSFFRNDVRLKWYVVETSAMARSGKGEFENEELKFFESLHLARRELNEIDLVFSSGTIMYVPEPRLALKELVDSGAKFLFLTRLALTSRDRDIIALQESRLRDNGPGPLPPGFRDGKARYPITLIRKDDCESIIEAKYNLRLKFDEGMTYQVRDNRIFGHGYFAEKISTRAISG